MKQGKGLTSISTHWLHYFIIKEGNPTSYEVNWKLMLLLYFLLN